MITDASGNKSTKKIQDKIFEQNQVLNLITNNYCVRLEDSDIITILCLNIAFAYLRR